MSSVPPLGYNSQDEKKNLLLIIGILVSQMGGAATITDAELLNANNKDLDIIHQKDPMMLKLVVKETS